jgi:hypothetical protein
MARERERMLAEGLMAGWDRGTAIPVLIQAMGGLCVGQVTKYAGGVKKGFAVVSGILLTTLLQVHECLLAPPPPSFARWPLHAGHSIRTQDIAYFSYISDRVGPSWSQEVIYDS